ncbi:MAG: triose-phosphate isomerase [Salinisphaeraceae bacterium]|nr:triose-phosphate isomerase [Salinisphaeraceae bacterium]
MSRKPMVAGNWKMHGSLSMTRQLASDVADGIAELNNVETCICPPYPYLQAACEATTGSDLSVGAQDISEQVEQGAYTGEVNGAMLKDLGCSAVLVGHSERRQYYGEDNDRVAEKFMAVQVAGLMPVLCIGETQAEREAGETEVVLKSQLRAVLDKAGIISFSAAVIAYEPVWAIGTGLTASPEQAQAAHAFIRGIMDSEDAIIARDLRLLYGGSVKPDNATALFSCPDVDGGLIGGAALEADSFIRICQAAAEAAA